MIRHSISVGWADVPLRRYVDDARVQLAVLMFPSGQVVAQHGFQRRLDVQTACALSAAINATADRLGTMIDGQPFTGLHYVGRERQLHLAHLPAGGGVLLLLSVFDRESSLGIVQLYLDDLAAALEATAPAAEEARPALAEDFERDLDTNLAALFGRR